MRISADKDDPAYDRVGSYRVFLNGVEQLRAITADDVTGELVRYVCIDGRIQRDAAGLLRETVHGVVRFEKIRP